MQVANLSKAFVNYLSTDIKLSKIELSKTAQSSGGFLGRLFGSLGITKNRISVLVLIPSGLTAAASAANAGMHKRILASGSTTLIIANEEMENIRKNSKIS